MNGTIFNIKRYSIHDGPGIRTTVFLKGCPLSCIWCHNPEGIQQGSGFFFDAKLCLNCLRCVQSCSLGSITKSKELIKIDLERCSHCDECVNACPTNALRKNGRNYLTDELMEVILKDIPFYDESGGGVTFSGGEPLYQLEFLHEMLMKCKERGIHTVVDTSGYCYSDKLKEIVDLVDLFLYDIKCIDDIKHGKYTGVSNSIIKENLRFLISQKKCIWIRIPLIPGLTDNDENIDGIIDLLKGMGFFGRVHLLPYHDLSGTKEMKMVEKDNQKVVGLIMKKNSKGQKLDIIKERFQIEGFDVRIGG